MSARSIVPLALGAMLLAPVAASAQPAAAPGFVSPVNRWYRGPGYGGGYGGYGGYGYSSNPIEGARRGLAEVIRAKGEANVANADALLTYEETRSRYLDNKLKWVDTYWEMKRITEAEQQKDIDKKRARRDAWRYNRPRTLSRLNPNQLDPSTGKIYWPTGLQDPSFYNQTKKLDELFLIRAQTQSVPGLQQDINVTTQAMKEELKTHIHDMTPHEYLEARKFIDGLNYEVHLPSGGFAPDLPPPAG